MTTGIRLKLLGQFSIATAEGNVIRLPSRKAQALLAYLALNPDQHHSRSKLATLLWSRHDDEHARNNLSQCLYRLRGALAPLAERVLHIDKDGVTLTSEALEVDILTLRQLAADGSPTALREAAALGANDLLGEFAIREEVFEEWLARERAAVAKLTTDLLTVVAESQLEVGDGVGAIRTATRLVANDTLNESAQRLLMRAQMQAGRRDAALQQYRSCVETLRMELGAEPEAATTALYDEMRQGRAERPPIDATPNNLPSSLSSFVGRRAEIAEVTELLGSTRLLTLVGAGGSGKTRLCLRAAADVLGTFPDGVWFVELAGLTDPELVPRQVAWSLGVSEKVGRRWSEVLGAFLRDREILLILDNCEHLIRSVADLITDLLQGSPKLRVLTTSREVLNLPGEVAWQTPLLSHPNDEDSSGLDGLMRYEAVQLFVERARAVRNDVDFHDEDARTVAHICRRLEGLPLALELAAARLRALSVQQVARHLDDRFSLLKGGDRAALPRQQTLRATVSWSYELLSPEEQRIFARMSVFAGGFGIEAAIEVSGDEALDGIASLVDKSLLVTALQGDDMRYHMLETFREFGLEQLGDEAVDAKNDLLAWSATLAHEAAIHLEGPRQTEWLNKVETELQNFRAAMQWGLDSLQPALGITIATGLHRYWYLRGIREGERWLDLFLTSPMDVGNEVKAASLYAAGTLSQALGRYDQAADRLDESLKLFGELGDRRRAAWSLHFKMRAQWGRIEPEKIREMIDLALCDFRQFDDIVGIATSLIFVMFWELGYGDPDRALESADDLEAACELTGSPHLMAHGFELPAVALTKLQQYEIARPLFRKALELYRPIGQQCAAHCLENAAGWALGNGQPVDSVVLMGATDAFRTDIGVPCPPYENLLAEDILMNAKVTIGLTAFEAAWQQGQAMDITMALNVAIRATNDASDEGRD